MAGLIKTIAGLFQGRRREVSEEEAVALREAFRARCDHFRMLLAANHSALEVMSQMEEAMRGRLVFGMSTVRGQCTRVSAAVLRIVRHLNGMTGDRYQALNERFRAIQQRIAEHVETRRDGALGPLVLPLGEVSMHMADEAGGKMASLGEIVRRVGLSVPPGFVITASAFRRFMVENDLQTEIDRRIQTADASRLDELYALSSSLRQLITQAPLPGDLAAAIMEQYRGLEAQAGPGIRVALRSSAVGEDALGASFAGQYESELNVPAEEILDTYKEVVASKYGVAAMTYRLNRGIRDEDVPMCVGCMVMVDAVAGGVAYSRNPLDIRDEIVEVNAVHGLPKAVVDGTFNPDLFIVRRGDPPRLERSDLARKEFKYVCDPEKGLMLRDLSDDEANAPALNEEQAVEVARLSMALEDYYGRPQDVEWALTEQGRILLLQSRPLHESGGETKGVAEVRSDEPGCLAAGGVTAAPGVGAGPVFAVRRDADALRFPEGAVLVAAKAQPRWAPLLSRASALVCEAGSAAGHLANVAREYGLPAVFGLENALAVMEGAGEVTVDADNRRVHAGRRDDLLARRQAARNLMEGSPVLQSLRQAAQHIVPLNLIDPEGPDFRPERCETLHDITRFCHEKSVGEMFKSGGSALPEHCSKQLVAGAKLKYWVIDLDDGFRSPVEGSCVDISNIQSDPMLALWEGMTAVPWAGPPATDARGFLSIVAGAASTPDLDPARASAFTLKNFFMVSREFCNLQSRFGFHFATVESLATAEPGQNYVSFQFKGGGADLSRRVARADFVAELLEEYGFRAEVREDAVFARAEEMERQAVLDRLKVLGYLLIHTRQIDMVMGNEYVAGPILAKIRSDAAGICPPGM